MVLYIAQYLKLLHLCVVKGEIRRKCEKLRGRRAGNESWEQKPNRPIQVQVSDTTMYKQRDEADNQITKFKIKRLAIAVHE